MTAQEYNDYVALHGTVIDGLAGASIHALGIAGRNTLDYGNQ